MDGSEDFIDEARDRVRFGAGAEAVIETRFDWQRSILLVLLAVASKYGLHEDPDFR
jgi:hypothetical protein